jgi:hypothetical protein
MTLDIPRYRLDNQFLSQTDLTEPSQVVEWLGAVQSQDYAGAKWALAQRLKDAPRDAVIEKAFNEGEILRTHVMRPTWHFVTPEDIRWMLDLTAPRVRIAMAHVDRQLGLDKSILKKSNTALSKALQGNRHLTRFELAPILEKAGVSVDNYRMGQLMLRAELDQVVCSGSRKGKQFTYALLEERAPQSKSLERDEALAELAKRYFRSHGPATLQDFVWWSGLTINDARKGIEFIKSQLVCETIDGQSYWFVNPPSESKPFSGAQLLPNYDEYMVGYTDRTSIFDAAHKNQLDSRGNILFQYAIMLDGLVAGTWKRTIKKKEVVIELSPFMTLTTAEHQAVIAAAQEYGKFLELPIVLV